MATIRKPSLTRFINALRELQRNQASTTQPNLKQEIISTIKDVTMMANQGNARACYWLARAHKNDSKRYRFWMKRAFKSGHLAAGLDWSKSLLGKQTPSIAKAAKIIKLLQTCDDSFVRDQANQLVAQNPQLQKELSMQHALSQNSQRRGLFFANRKALPATLVTEAPIQENSL